jgi:pimeloyl-ACP methyl ester carboxylesterase
MDFSLRRIGQENLHYYESDQESKVQLVFVSGGFNPELWKHQIKYFSRKYKAISFQPTQSFRDIEGEREALRNILAQKELDNVVLISSLWGNSVTQEFEDHENVRATVFTGASRNLDIRQKSLYNMFWSLGSKKPKILKKALFSNETKYGVVKEFVEDLRVPDYSDIRSFGQSYRMKRPSTPSLIIHAQEDNRSSLEFARELGDNASISIIERAGVFSFYEKPQEYNKVLSDFLLQVEEAVEEKELIETRNKNRSLFEFEKNQQKEKKPKKVITK